MVDRFVAIEAEMVRLVQEGSLSALELIVQVYSTWEVPIVMTVEAISQLFLMNVLLRQEVKRRARAEEEGYVVKSDGDARLGNEARRGGDNSPRVGPNRLGNRLHHFWAASKCLAHPAPTL